MGTRTTGGNITYGNNASRNIILAFVRLHKNYIGSEVTVILDSDKLTGSTEFTTTISQGSSTMLDGTELSSTYGVIPITEAHDLDWYNERNGTYKVTLSIGSESRTYTLIIDVPNARIGFLNDTYSFEAFDSSGTFE